jgi:hypothetical protein
MEANNNENNSRIINNNNNNNNQEDSDDTQDTTSLMNNREINNLTQVRTGSRSKLLPVITILLTIFSAVLYYLSLEGCQYDTQTACLVNLSPEFFHKIGVFLLTSSFIMSFISVMIILRYVHYAHLVYISAIFTYLFLLDTGANLTNHGSYNRAVFLIFIGVCFAVLVVMRLLFKLVQSKYRGLFFLACISGFLFSIYLSSKLTKGCEKWSLGLLGKKITDHQNCKIREPQSCWIELLDGLMDVSWLLQEDCQNFRGGERAELLKYMPERYRDSYRLGYPITTNFTYIPESYHMPFFWNLMSNFIDLDNPDNNNKTKPYHQQKPEVVLEFDKETKFGKIKIEINKNEEMIKEREAKAKDNPTKTKNILFIYVDSISRQHFLRKMKKTRAFIEKYMNKTRSEFNAYQFMKYHTFIYFTQPNVNPMFYGESMFHNNGTHIVRHLKDKGFVTGHAINICSRELYDIEEGYIEKLQWEAFDHENVALFCDPNYFNPENPFTPYMGPYSVRKRCLYGKDTFQYIFDYSEKFWEAYLPQRKFLRLAFQDAHEGTGEVARYLDDELIVFLENFEKRGWLEDTTILIASDHGNNMIGFYNIFNCEDFVLEKTLGAFFMLTPSNNTQFNNTNLLNNEEVLVTPYDIYDTMMDVINMDKGAYSSRYGQSLFNHMENGELRNCENYKLDMLDLWCRCENKN